jgi:hypothetical protein
MHIAVRAITSWLRYKKRRSYFGSLQYRSNGSRHYKGAGQLKVQLTEKFGIVKVIDTSLTENHSIANRFVSSYAFPVLNEVFSETLGFQNIGALSITADLKM